MKLYRVGDYELYRMKDAKDIGAAKKLAKEDWSGDGDGQYITSDGRIIEVRQVSEVRVEQIELEEE